MRRGEAFKSCHTVKRHEIPRSQILNTKGDFGLMCQTRSTMIKTNDGLSFRPGVHIVHEQVSPLSKEKTEETPHQQASNSTKKS